MTQQASTEKSTAAQRLDLPASWYVAVPSDQLGKGPRQLTLFGRNLVAWRNTTGQPVVAQGHCPHLGASLGEGRVTGGDLQCASHRWRFDDTGRCVAAPPAGDASARPGLRTYPAVERHGYVWVWYGSREPMFALPSFPALDTATGYPTGFRMADDTRATVRRILENTYDPDHLVALHGLEVDGSTKLRMLDDPGATADHGPPVATQAWLGAELTWPSYSGQLGMITRLLGTNAKQFVLRVDGWPSGQRISYFADGRLQYRMLLAASPLGPNRTIQHIAVALPRTGARWRDLRNYVLHRPEITMTSQQDIPLFNTIERGDRHGIYVGGDHGVLAFRKYYQQWVDRVADDA
ncbi:Rieske 2Fe-2S domain-containing protein [Actinoplanes sp. HUAS TT8]|uniref:Rieske 2Fe-2S domain-containing protein n=1 Tax=Actinoplanes sp. HUAS TT8 TaxID=3447453 RepID=UPI003F521300